MLGHEKSKMMEIIKRYIEDQEYRKKINSTDFASLSELEKVALEGIFVTDDGAEIVDDIYYSPYNSVNVSTEVDLAITCMNMAVATLLDKVFDDEHVKRYAKYGLVDIKPRIKADLFLDSDKPAIINFIRIYHKSFPKYLPEKAEEYRDMYYRQVLNGQDDSTFVALAKTFNTNIYLGELVVQDQKKGFSKRKR